MGSPSDKDKMQPAVDLLGKLGIESEVHVMSAHRHPGMVADFVDTAPTKGVGVFICGAGMSAHLAGAVAARTVLPVIGVPLSGGLQGGLDALMSTVQMPPGMPVATVAVDGAANAALLAAQIIALAEVTADPDVPSSALSPVGQAIVADRERRAARR